MKRLVAIALALIGLSVGVGGCLGERRGTGVSRAVDLIPRGGEQPLPGATFDNGFNILTLGPCDFARAYADAKLFTGPPIAAFDGRGQSFYFLRLVCAPTDPHAQVTFENLGAQALLARGMVRLPDSEPHPVVRAFLVDAQQAGLDTRALFGRVLSPPLCRGARCQQYLDNVLLEFDGSDPETPVRFAPLGCELTLACARAKLLEQAAGTSGNRWRLLIWGGAALGLAGIALLAQQRLSGGSGRRITI